MSKRNSYIMITVLVLIAAAIPGSAVFVSKMLSEDINSTVTEIDTVKGQLSTNEQEIEKLSTEVKSTLRSVPSSSDIQKLKRENTELRNALIQMQKVCLPKWVKNPYNGNLYCKTQFAMGWHGARDFAISIGGHLVTIEDENENQWLVDKFGGNAQYWIGLTDEGTEGKWQWVDGSEMKFNNWLPGEPDNYKSNQHHVIINAKVPAKGQIVPGHWNDVPAWESRPAIIEMSK